MAHMVANPYASMCSPFQGHVVGVEHIADLVELSIRNMRKSPSTARLIDCNLIEVIAEDGRSGYAIGGPYDAIHVGAAANEVGMHACPVYWFLENYQRQQIQRTVACFGSICDL